jgi:predicted alpha/beta superfamily hydrolase
VHPTYQGMVYARMKAGSTLAILMAILIMRAVPAGARTDQEDPLVFDLKIDSEILHESRTISVSLPDDYYLTSYTYPVLYLLDGRSHFRHATSAVDFLSREGIIPEMIVVSIHNVDRSRDFLPIHDETIPTSGGADRFLKFFEKELSGLIRERTRASEYTVLMGHSAGGTFAAHALNTRPALFDAFILVSPYLQFMDNYVVKEAADKIKPCSKGKSMYLSVGNEPDYFDPIDAYVRTLKTRAEGTVDYKYEKMMSEIHGSISYLSVYKGLKHIFGDWHLSGFAFQQGLEAIAAHFRKVSAKYDSSVEPPEALINQLGYYYLRNGDVQRAIEVFRENTKRYPASANVYDSLGEAYERNGQLVPAQENYSRACELAKTSGEEYYSIFKQHLDRVEGETPNK